MNPRAHTGNGDEISFEARYYQAAGQLETARAVESLLKLQIEQLLQQHIATLRSGLPHFKSTTAAAAPLALGAPLHSAMPSQAGSDDFAAVWLREKHYASVMRRFQPYLFPSHSPKDTADYSLFWDSLGGARVWSVRHSEETLDLLLSREERSEFTLRKNYRDAEEHRFVESVLARLPNLTCLRLNGVAYTLDPAFVEAAANAATPRAFAKLRVLDVSKCSTLTVTQLKAFVRAMKGLTEVHVGGCEALSWEDVCCIASDGPQRIAIVPATEEAFKASTDAQFIERIADEYVASCTIVPALLKLWRQFGSPDGRLRNGMTPKRLTAVLAKCETTDLLVGGVAGKDVPISCCVPAEEMTTFVTQVLARLPQLENLHLRRCEAGWPFDMAALATLRETGLSSPLPSLRHLAVRCTRWQPRRLIDIIASTPSLEDNMAEMDSDRRNSDATMALEVDLEEGPADVDVREVRQACKGKLYIWAN